MAPPDDQGGRSESQEDDGTHRLPRLGTGRAGEIVGSGDGSGLRLGVVCARYNEAVTLRLLDGAERAAERCALGADGLVVAWVPGAFELPLAARAFASTGALDAVVCLGAVIRGETSHYDFVAGQCAAGLQQVQLETGLPVVFGVLTTDNLDQALARSGGDAGDKGAEAILTAVEMVHVTRAISRIAKA